MDTFLSIITPVYNRADCLEACLESVTAQSGEIPVEHVVVDDGSTDDTYAILDRYAAAHPSVRALKLDRNRGTNAARNAAVRAAKGKWIMILDSDDTLAPGALAAVKEAIARHPDCRHFLFAVSDRAEEFASAGIPRDGTREYLFRDFLDGLVSGDFAHVLLRDTMTRFPFDEELRIYEGVFFLSFYKEAARMLLINKVIIDRDRGRDDRVTYTLLPDNDATLRRTVAAIDLLLERFGTERLRTSAGRAALESDLVKKYRFETFLGDRSAAAATARKALEVGFSVPSLYKMLNATYLGRAFFKVGRLYVKLKFALGVRPD